LPGGQPSPMLTPSVVPLLAAVVDQSEKAMRPPFLGLFLWLC
jgi:hypothetical protein